MATSMPFMPVLPHLVDLLHAMVAEPTKAVDDDDFEYDWRDQCAHAVLLLPATCREARALSKLDEGRWAWLCAFEQFRMGAARATFRHRDLLLYDGLPSWINNLSTASCGTRSITDAHPDQRLVGSIYDAPHYCSVVWVAFAMRLSRDAHLKDALPASADVAQHTAGLVANEAMPANLPLRVRVFAGFLRWSLQYGLRDAIANGLNSCARRGCPREAHPEDSPTWNAQYAAYCSSAPGGQRSEDDEAAHEREQLRVYWETVRSVVDIAAEGTDEVARNRWHLDNMRFCSGRCAKQVWDEYDQCVRCATCAELSPAPDEARSRRPPNTSKMYSQALERNANFARRMRADRGQIRLRHWDDGFSAAVEREQWVRALNVDAAMLYAASFFAELGHARRSRKAVPARPGWRGAGAAWLNALSRICSIMKAKESRCAPPMLATNYFSPPSWFAGVKDAALSRIF